MTKTVTIPLTELQEIYQGIEAFVLNAPGDAIALASWKEQLELRMAAARSLGHLSAYVIYSTPKPTMEYDYTLDHYGLDNWQAEWGNGDIERDIVVEYSESDVLYKFDYRVLMDGKDITSTLNKGNRKTFESLMEKEYLDRTAQLRDHAYD
jgi:hypothetical protein